jgi:transcriptional regulator with XRE-family HTH domain
LQKQCSLDPNQISKVDFSRNNAEPTACAAKTRYREGKLSRQQIADRLRISKTTLYSYLRNRGKVGQKPIGTNMIENVLAKDINGLEPKLTREGCDAKVLPEILNTKPREIKSFLCGQLAPGRTQELQNELLAAGIPL